MKKLYTGLLVSILLAFIIAYLFSLVVFDHTKKYDNIKQICEFNGMSGTHYFTSKGNPTTETRFCVNEEGQMFWPYNLKQPSNIEDQ